jgi:hypothetical protein
MQQAGTPHARNLILNHVLNPIATPRSGSGIKNRIRGKHPALFIAALIAFFASPLVGRTITICAESLDGFVALSETHPRNGWAAYSYDETRYGSNPPGAGPKTSYILRYSLDKIPKGMRITRAEWVVAHNVASSTFHVWRVLGDWGIGACYQYRAAYPKKLEWSVPGARGKSTDRATNPTATAKFGASGTLVSVNVTQDVEMWYNGAAPNRGWLLAFEGGALLHSPTHDGHKLKWELKVTYEPE